MQVVNEADCHIIMYMFVGIAVPYFVYWNKVSMNYRNRR